MYRAIAANKRNTIFIIIAFIALITGLAFVIAWMFDGSGRYWPIITPLVLVGTGVYALIQYFAASRLAVAMAGGREIQRADEPRLYHVVETLAITDGLPMPRVFIIDDPAPNAFATGRDPEHAMVAATTGLLQLMDNQELEGVMAHEMGHVKNYDIRVSMIVFGLVAAVGVLSDIALRAMWFGGGNRNSNSGPAGIVMLVIGLIGLVLSPMIAMIVQAAVSRQREYLADATSAMTTRNPEGLARALEKLAQYGRPLQRQAPTMSHMWIADPTKPGLIDRMFATHPPLQDRIARLRENEGRF